MKIVLNEKSILSIKHVKKGLSAFRKYGITLPYEFLKWKNVKNKFKMYAQKYETCESSVLCLRKRTVNGLYDQKYLLDHCKRIIAGERKILFYENSKYDKLDPKYRWEEERLQHLYPLAIIILETNKQEAIKYFIQEIHYYNSDVRFKDTNAMEIAIASINLLVSSQIAGLKDEETNELIKREIVNNLIYILRNVENGIKLSNNHYFFNLLGVLWITEEIEQDRTSQHLHDYAEKEMKKLLNEMISRDGSLYEGSTYYTRYVAEALCEYLYYHSEKMLQYMAIIQRLISFLQGIACNGMIVGIGDNDSGRVLPVCNYYSYHSRSIIPIVEMAKELGMSINTQYGLGKYPDFGLISIKKEHCFVCLRCDSIENKRRNRILGGHEHNDQLSVQLIVQNEPIFVDPGTYLYISKDNCRINNMKTEFHSTFSIKGLEQNSISNDWNYKERIAVACVDQADEQVLSATVNYADVTHHRLITVGDHNIEIIDKIKAKRTGALTFILAPQLKILSVKGSEIILISESLEITIKSDYDIRIDKAFYSEEYGEQEETIKLVIEMKSFSRINVSWSEKRIAI